MHLLGAARISEKYRTWLHPELEPVLRLPGAAFIGLNSSHGIAAHTLTTRPRDLSVVGAVTDAQLARCTAELQRTPAGDLRAIVMHHNPVRGHLSQRFGIPNHRRVLQAFAAAGCELVLAAHDHQERVEAVTLGGDGGERQVVVSVCGTVSSRSRGGRPCSVTVIHVRPHEIALEIRMANSAGSAFEPGERFAFSRKGDSRA
jgi:hypothetical protein